MQSIEELLKNKPKKSGDAVGEKFQERMTEIHKKEMEAMTESNARQRIFLHKLERISSSPGSAFDSFARGNG